MEELLPQMPWAWLYFVTFILAGMFVALNFFVGIIVNNLQSVALEENNDLAESANLWGDWKLAYIDFAGFLTR